MGSVRRSAPIFCTVIFCACLVLISPSIGMRLLMSPYLFTTTDGLGFVDFALIPGASVIRGAPSPILALRADLGAALFEQKRVRKIIITGDNSAKEYDEVTPVFNYLRVSGVPESDMVLDRDGYDTYASAYNAKDIFRAHSLVIVTQDFHLPRAVFLARALGIEAYGVATAQGGTLFDYLREIPASWKGLWDVLLQRRPAQTHTGI